MSEIFKSYLGQQVRIVSGAGVAAFAASGVLREPDGQWLVVENAEQGRIFVRRDLVFFIESDAPPSVTTTLPRTSGGGE